MTNTPKRRGSAPLSRELDSREHDARKKDWQPANILPTPDPEDGYKFRWIRKEILGVADPTNFSRKVREGWETCRLDDYPQMAMYVDSTATASGMVVMGGLILCKMPDEMVAQRDAYYARNNNAQIESVDNSFMKENDPRMPLFKERKSQVSFGPR